MENKNKLARVKFQQTEAKLGRHDFLNCQLALGGQGPGMKRLSF